MTFLYYAAHKPAPRGIPTTALRRQSEEKRTKQDVSEGRSKRDVAHWSWFFLLHLLLLYLHKAKLHPGAL